MFPPRPLMASASLAIPRLSAQYSSTAAAPSGAERRTPYGAFCPAWTAAVCGLVTMQNRRAVWPGTGPSADSDAAGVCTGPCRRSRIGPPSALILVGRRFPSISANGPAGTWSASAPLMRPIGESVHILQILTLRGTPLPVF